MNKKAQIIGQIFVFILAVIVFSLILFYGYQQITKFLDHQSKIAVTTFQNTLSESVDSIKHMYGSTKKLELSIPRGFEQVCFSDSENAQNNKRFPLISHLASFKDQNVFLLPLQDFKINIENLRVKKDGSVCCLPAENKLVLRLDSTKEGVYVSPWEDYLLCNQ